MKRLLCFSIVAAAATAAACNSLDGPTDLLNRSSATDTTIDTTPGRRPPGPVASVVVAPPADTAVVGDSAGFFAVLLDAQGFPVDARVRWTVDDSSVARIEAAFGQSVVLRALQAGATLVTASSRGKTGSAQLFVVNSLPGGGDSVAVVTIVPAFDSVLVGDSASFFALLQDGNGNFLSRPVSWTVGDSSVAQIEAVFGPSVVVRAVGTGSSLITATSEGVSGSGVLIVGVFGGGGDSVATMLVRPAADTVAAGDTASFFAEPRAADGTFLGDRPISWTISDSTVIQIERDFVQSVVIRALRAGAAVLTATSEGKRASANVFVP